MESRKGPRAYREWKRGSDKRACVDGEQNEFRAWKAGERGERSWGGRVSWNVILAGWYLGRVNSRDATGGSVVNEM